MTTVQISKQRIIKAIKTEPIKPHTGWIKLFKNYNVGEFIPLKSKDCGVCAVGGVLRNILDKNQDWSAVDDAADTAIDSISSICGSEDNHLSEAKLLIKDELYMNALSTYFEGACDRSSRNGQTLSRHQMYRIKQKLVKFVKENFPNKININIDGAKPAKDVKVIS